MPDNKTLTPDTEVCLGTGKHCTINVNNEFDIQLERKAGGYKVEFLQKNENTIGSRFLETVVLLRDKKVDGHISIDLDVEKLAIPSVNTTVWRSKG